MKNHWLGTAKKKRIVNKIDDAGLEVWSEDGTFGDFFKRLTKQEKDFLMHLNLSDFVCEIDDNKFIFELVCLD